MSENVNKLIEIEKLIGQAAFEALVQDVYAELKKRALTETTYTKDEVNSLVNGLTKLTVQVVAELPETGEENILYLVPSKNPAEAAKNIKEEYLWIEGKYEVIGTTQAVENQIFKGQKTALEIADSEVISDYFELNSQITPAKGDVFIITTLVNGKVYELSAYIYDGSEWVAITGNVDAEKVIMRDNITLAGNYTQVGNVTKSANETKTLDVKGKSIKEVMMSIFTAKLQPGNPTQPSISGFSLSGAKAVEAGTKITSANWTQGNFNKGSYQYGPDTGVTANSWTVARVTNVSGLNTEVATSNAAGSDTNGDAGFIIGDQGGENVVNSLKYTMTVNHSDGVVAHDNLGGNSDPEKKITAGSKSASTGAYIPFRQCFYGFTNEKPEVNSAYIRGLTGTGKAYTKGNFMISVQPGAQRVVIACPATNVGVTQVINTSALNADVTETFIKQTVQVEGANGYTAIAYNVWVFEPAEAYGQVANLQVTLG
ncbi:MAG: hypothetical protein Q4P79_06960 [Fusobacterium sp.]|nr:hypothetical protein [Fusobacterium sp.]MDO5789189.1 hypothetical protein [Fusobacterium sp.]